jgi:tRNA threonylcarbamoyladenosine biosynthesis protein TsaE
VTELVERYTADEAALVDLGASLAPLTPGVERIYLYGELGSGKTTLVRGLLQGLGHRGAVKSPTFTLVEPYRIGERDIYHFDLYRLKDPEELEFMGVRDYLEGGGLCLIEWADRAAGFLPAPDIAITISKTDKGRMVHLESHTDSGHQFVSRARATLPGAGR